VRWWNRNTNPLGLHQDLGAQMGRILSWEQFQSCDRWYMVEKEKRRPHLRRRRHSISLEGKGMQQILRVRSPWVRGKCERDRGNIGKLRDAGMTHHTWTLGTPAGHGKSSTVLREASRPTAPICPTSFRPLLEFPDPNPLNRPKNFKGSKLKIQNSKIQKSKF
jgi:hypothetical protein